MNESLLLESANAFNALNALKRKILLPFCKAVSCWPSVHNK